MLSFKRGFFCGDASLRFPYHENTISVLVLLLCVLLMPIVFISVAEVIRLWRRFQISDYLRNAGYSLACFSYGFIATYLTTEIGKLVVQRLRPHFFAACMPQLKDGSTCADAKNRLIWLEDYHCSNLQMSANQIRELYVSFPSAHSSLSFYSMLFLAFYLHAMWHNGSTAQRILRPLLQYVLLAVAYLISLSRLTDFWHHSSDVLAGSVLGVISATLTAVYVGRFFETNSPTNTTSGFLPSAPAAATMVVSNHLKSNLDSSALQHVPTNVAFDHTLNKLQCEDQTSVSNATRSSTLLQTSLEAVKEHLISSDECIWK